VEEINSGDISPYYGFFKDYSPESRPALTNFPETNLPSCQQPRPLSDPGAEKAEGACPTAGGCRKLGVSRAHYP
jgi:hypothetical protein